MAFESCFEQSELWRQVNEACLQVYQSWIRVGISPAEAMAQAMEFARHFRPQTGDIDAILAAKLQGAAP